jgi:hypothetical protein
MALSLASSILAIRINLVHFGNPKIGQDLKFCRQTLCDFKFRLEYCCLSGLGATSALE